MTTMEIADKTLAAIQEFHRVRRLAQERYDDIKNEALDKMFEETEDAFFKMRSQLAGLTRHGKAMKQTAVKDAKH